MWYTDKAALTIEGPWWQTVLGNMYDFPLEEMRLVKLPGPHPPKALLDMVMVSTTGYSLVPEEAWTVLKVLWLEDPQWRDPNPMMGGLPGLKVAYGRMWSLNLLRARWRRRLGRMAWLGWRTRRLLRFSARWRMR